MAPSCFDCPSYTDAARAASMWGKGVNAPICAARGIVLERPSAPVETVRAVLQHRASTCPLFGKPVPERIPEPNYAVALPSPTWRKPSVEPNLKTTCKSCATCTRFVPESAVLSETLWAAGICPAKGVLVPSNRRVIEASDCEYREFGPNLGRIPEDMLFYPEYMEDFVESGGFGSASTPLDTFLAGGKMEGVVEPSEYESDRPVTPEDRAGGVRAWRKISSPTDPDLFTWLPIYDASLMPEERIDLIPKTGSDEHPELYRDHFGGVYSIAVAWGELDETPALWGEAGVGKTELFRHMAWLMQLPFVRLSISASSELDDLAGKMRYTPEAGTYFQYGRLPYNWTMPCVICVDEPNTGPLDVWQFLRPLTDNSKQLVLDMNGGEIIPRSEDCYMGMAMNPSWDPRNIGALPLGDADTNRLFHIWLELPPPEIERAIIKHRVALDGWEISKDKLNFVMNVARDIRLLVEQGTLPITWAIRPQIRVARALRWFSPVEAYKRAACDFLEPQVATQVLDVVRSHVPSESTPRGGRRARPAGRHG